MQYRHPMHVFSFTRTTPSFVWNVAPTGQTWTQGGLAHWLQSFGTKKERRIDLSDAISGDGSRFGSIALTTVVPFFLVMYRSTHVRKKNGSRGTLFSFLHASMQRAQPMHLSTETPNPYHFCPFGGASRASAFEGRIFRIPPIAPPERRTERKPLRNVLRPFTVPPPANGDNGIASRRTSRRARPCRSSGRTSPTSPRRSSPTSPSRPSRGISRRTRGSGACSASPRGGISCAVGARRGTLCTPAGRGGTPPSSVRSPRGMPSTPSAWSGASGRAGCGSSRRLSAGYAPPG